MKNNFKIGFIEGLFIDLDGVVLRNSLEVYLKYVTDYINKFIPLPLSYIKNYYRTVNSFPQLEAFHIVFDSLGLGNELKALLESIIDLKEYNNEKITIGENFYDIVSFCDKNNIQYKIFTMASFEKTKSFLPEIPRKNICCLDKRSKADLKTYELIKKELKINLQNWVLVDDDPVALQTAHLSGLTTILMKNNLFDSSYCKEFKKSIDIAVESFSDIIKLFKGEQV